MASGKDGSNVKALEFITQMNPDQTPSLPPGIAGQLRPRDLLRVLVLVADAPAEKDWAESATEAFLTGYAETDASYDPLAGK